MSRFEDNIRASSQHRALVGRYAEAITAVAVDKGTKPGAMMGALLGNLVAIVKASAPPGEWRECGRVLGREVERQLGDAV